MKYLGELIGSEYRGWRRKKILISAPTGIGKSTFILKTLLPHIVSRGQKMLILCNRKLLRDQYWSEVIEGFDDYETLCASVDVKTYQEVARYVKETKYFRTMFQEYDVICCDECHYFYADSDFNPFGTYVLLQTIILAGMGKQMVFLSATMDEVEPLIRKTITKAIELYSREHPEIDSIVEYGEIKNYRFDYLADYDRFQCICVPDKESLFDRLMESTKKAIVFIDSKDDAEKLTKYCRENGEDSVMILHSDNLDKNEKQSLIREMVNAHKLNPKILITTAVLDNGVSIQDPDVENVAIITDSRVSFLQMLGRVRAGHCEKVKLFFVLREAGIFEKRAKQYKEYLDFFEELEAWKNLDTCNYDVIDAVWNGVERKADIYRTLVIPMKNDIVYYDYDRKKGPRGRYGDIRMVLNFYGKKKIGNMYLREEKFARLAQNSLIEVVYEQMKWIGKKPEELEVLGNSTYKERKLKEFREYLCTISDVDNKGYMEMKTKIAKDYKEVLPGNLQIRGGTFSEEKLNKILSIMNLQLKKVVKNEKEEGEKTTKKTYYSIIEEEPEKETEVSEHKEEI